MYHDDKDTASILR